MVIGAHLYIFYIIFGLLEFFVAIENIFPSFEKVTIAVEGLHILISYLKEVTCNHGGVGRGGELVSQITLRQYSNS